jgi:hypothetical protein
VSVAIIHPSPPLSEADVATLRRWLGLAARESDYFNTVVVNADCIEIPSVDRVYDDEGRARSLTADAMAGIMGRRMAEIIGRPLAPQPDPAA